MIDNILDFYIAAFVLLLSARILGANVSVQWLFAPVVAFVSTCAIVDVLGRILIRQQRELMIETDDGEDTDDDSKGTP